MTIKLDLLQHDAPSVFAAQLAHATRDELVEVVVGDVDFCPNRVVPIVGVADAYVARDFDIRFKVPPHSAGERALGGFNARSLNPAGPIPNAFGRVWRFDNAAEQTALVSALAFELDKTTNLAPGVKQCFEWCLNEVTDNVLNHSRPEGGAHGYAMVQFVPADRRLKICVFDTGIGLKTSFAGSRYAPATSAEAIRMAVRKGVTNGKGQGNGLWGLHEIVKISKRGKLHIRSDGAEYLFDPSVPSESDRQSWTLEAFPGTTTVDFQMPCSQATSLQYVFGADYVSVDLWQEAREQADGSLLLKVAELADGFGSRESARKVRHLVENAIDNDRKFVVIDFAGVENCSSSFIDELLCLLMMKYGAMTYPNVFRIANLSGLPAGLANFSASQRLSASELGVGR